MHKTAESIEEAKLSANSEGISEARKRSLANLTPFRPGQSGNPRGRPRDRAAEIARQIFEENEAAIYTALGKSLLKGNFYGFKELAERAFGKLKEIKEVTYVNGDLSERDLDGQIRECLTALGLADQIDAAGSAAGKAAPNGKAKD